MLDTSGGEHSSYLSLLLQSPEGSRGRGEEDTEGPAPSPPLPPRGAFSKLYSHSHSSLSAQYRGITAAAAPGSDLADRDQGSAARTFGSGDTAVARGASEYSEDIVLSSDDDDDNDDAPIGKTAGPVPLLSLDLSGVTPGASQLSRNTSPRSARPSASAAASSADPWARLYAQAHAQEVRQQQRRGEEQRRRRAMEGRECTFSPSILESGGKNRQYNKQPQQQQQQQQHDRSSESRRVTPSRNLLNEYSSEHAGGGSPRSEGSSAAASASASASAAAFDRLYREAAERRAREERRRERQQERSAEEIEHDCTFHPELSPSAKARKPYASFREFLEAQETATARRERLQKAAQRSPGASPRVPTNPELEKYIVEHKGYVGPITGWKQHAEEYSARRGSSTGVSPCHPRCKGGAKTKTAAAAVDSLNSTGINVSPLSSTVRNSPTGKNGHDTEKAGKAAFPLSAEQLQQPATSPTAGAAATRTSPRQRSRSGGSVHDRLYQLSYAKEHLGQRPSASPQGRGERQDLVEENNARLASFRPFCSHSPRGEEVLKGAQRRRTPLSGTRSPARRGSARRIEELYRESALRNERRRRRQESLERSKETFSFRPDINESSRQMAAAAAARREAEAQARAQRREQRQQQQHSEEAGAEEASQRRRGQQPVSPRRLFNMQGFEARLARQAARRDEAREKILQQRCQSALESCTFRPELNHTSVLLSTQPVRYVDVCPDPKGLSHAAHRRSSAGSATIASVLATTSAGAAEPKKTVAAPSAAAEMSKKDSPPRPPPPLTEAAATLTTPRGHDATGSTSALARYRAAASPSASREVSVCGRVPSPRANGPREARTTECTGDAAPPHTSTHTRTPRKT